MLNSRGSNQGIVDGSPGNTEFSQLSQKAARRLRAEKATLWKVRANQPRYRRGRSPLGGRETGQDGKGLKRGMTAESQRETRKALHDPAVDLVTGDRQSPTAMFVSTSTCLSVTAGPRPLAT